MSVKSLCLDYKGKKIQFFETEFQGQRYVGKFRQCLLFAMGYGADQAAELKFEMAKKRRLMSESRKG